MRKQRRIAWSLLAVFTLLATASTWVWASPLPQEVGQELLKNPGFEGINCPVDGWCEGNWTRDTFNGAVYSEIYSPEGWVTFWSEDYNSLAGMDYGRPECKVIPNAAPFLGPPARVNSGNYAIQQFGFYRPIDSGIYQRVTGLSPGATVQASAYAHAWTCDEDGDPYSCGDTYQMLFQVGIDPTGGTNPWSGNIVWASGYSYDEYRKIGPVETQVGEGGNVTVFLRATAKWGFKHNDVYWDDASLVYVTPPATPTNTPLPPPPTNTPGPSPTPGPTSTPRPDGAIVHVVEPGDTLFGIALQYGVEVEQILELNAGSIGTNNMIWTDQELVIDIPENAPPTVAPTAPATGEVTPGAGVTPTAVADTTVGSVCVLAFNDRNGDTFRQPETEELLPNAVFSVGDANGLVGQYTTDGLSEPYCFSSLSPGTYQVTMQPPDGYSVSGPSYMAVGLSGGMDMNVGMGAKRGDSAPGPEGSETPTVDIDNPDNPDEGEDGGGSFWSTAARWVARIGGILLLVIAVVIAAVFFLSRRR
jgi:LysM repeat protein